MENLVFTQLSILEIRQLFRQELQAYFDLQPLSKSIAEEDQLLTIQQAADFLKLSVPTLYGFVSKSQLPVSKKGKRLYFSKRELIDWIKTGRKKTAAEIQQEATNYVNRKAK
jgi:excisionase family DNA binding protein